jgi:MHS family proline/betaine transporter-like MFS transporter
MVFGYIGDKYGRKVALSSSIMCMALPTVTIGFIPTYHSIGIAAPTIVIIARMLQGLSMGGALTGSMSFVIEHSSPKHRGFTGSLPMLGICVGILLGSLVVGLSNVLLTPEQLESWGWRLPFLLGILVVFVGLHIRKYTTETPAFEKIKASGSIVEQPIKQALTKHWRAIIVSILLNSTGSVVFYVQAIYATSFFTTVRGFDPTMVAEISSLCYMVMAVLTVFAGWLSDLIGRRLIYVLNIGAIIIATPFIMHAFNVGGAKEIIIAQLALSALAACYIGPEPALQAELYPAKIRSTALSISYNLATSLFGGTAPYVMALLAYGGSMQGCVWYIIACSTLSGIALAFYRRAAA